MANSVDAEVSYPEVDTVELPAEAPVGFDEAMFDTEDESILEEPVVLTE